MSQGQVYDESAVGTDDVIKSNKPSNSAFKQQKLRAWQPILTAKTVLPIFITIGILFIVIGVGLFYFSKNLHEIKIDYTNCLSLNNVGKECADEINNWDERNGFRTLRECKCEVQFHLDTDYKGDVLMYYALTNFFQNHRKYIRSRDDSQLAGKNMDREPASDCNPYGQETFPNDTKTKTGKWYWPCGVIANSMFQDEIELYRGTGSNMERVWLLNTGIAWESDKANKFKNPQIWKNAEDFANHPRFIKPKSWIKGPFDLDPGNPDNNGVQNEDFIIWMRTAALPSFRKLYRKLNRTQEGFEDGMLEGNYTLKIKYSYPVRDFDGTKSIIFSTTSVFGSKNPFLGFAYMGVGGICLFLGILFLFIHLKYGKSSWKMTHMD